MGDHGFVRAQEFALKFYDWSGIFVGLFLMKHTYAIKPEVSICTGSAKFLPKSNMADRTHAAPASSFEPHRVAESTPLPLQIYQHLAAQ